ncbi:cation-transporting P-type ATPase [Pseudomonas sp. WS 5018]|uniref:Cation-transporting P-type ATPase n=2 Tax=Gammaproteobacteria TaxID=1236 RepID=A0A4V3RDM9_STUST|nr:cation-transporting P-type ATPase [Stutzerimonas stutzeri]NMY63706.1 cation-transporting P-type ATPase [Pseudomonas sp. WS 5018]HAV04720.1 cation-transporting P-type ATPase [Pseudomonas sp.]AEA85108.1 cation-transporting P-type ATPase [Stutzerimonas stutzeri DSM 4166]MDH0148856.1 cation-transporting P-type ATPase [Stutzerimonas stutzeri]MDH0149246.1 cation-transporting P-type ATPase [Stutzerimonas stutzeri]
MPEQQIQSTRWHARQAEEALLELDSTAAGLTHEQAAQRLLRYGPNRLDEAKPASVWQRVLRHLNNVLLYVLIAAALVTGLMGHWVDTFVIIAVVVLNVAIGFVQEGKAEKALQAIRHLLAPHAVVLRDGRQQDIDAADLVPGDVVLLASGDSLPADVRLLQARSLRIDEAALTGESVPVDKQVDAVADDAAIGDRICMGYAGTLVTQGQARAVVVATGAATEIGRIGRMLEAVEQGTTPLLRKMQDFGRILTLFILATGGLLFLFGTLVRGMGAGEMFMAAVGLSVAAIPEGLPAIMTITLAIGVQRMAARNAVIRRLPAVEALGSVTVICSDKTGTLTRNEMTVQEVICAGQSLDVEGAGYAPTGSLLLQGSAVDAAALAAHSPAAAALVEAAALCNDASLHEKEQHWVLAGDPTEGALLTLAMKAGLSPTVVQVDRPRLDVIPFESEHRFMATLHACEAGSEVLVKGAPERILAMCSQQLEADGVERALDEAHWHNQIEAQARAGRRVLAFARCRLGAGKQDLEHADVASGLTLLGLVGIIDPPRDEAIRAVAQCRAAGIRVVMITGDHGVTASAIARQLGMGEDIKAITGPELELMDDTAMRQAVAEARVFARASPEHKLRLVRALQANGEVVAMTGDGVNDAPALKQADVGVAMGMKGTEAAKQAGAIVLADDNFASIAHAVEEGRTVYDNLRKTVTFLLPINGGESLSLLLAVLLGLALPITPVQVLWVNMVSSVALAMVLAFEPTEADVMQRPPRRPDEPMLSRFVIWRIFFVSALFLVGIFGMYQWMLAQGATVEAARTVAVNTLVCMEVFYLFSVRYLKAPSFTVQGVKGTPRVLVAVFSVFGLQLLFTYAPFMQSLFASEALRLDTGMLVVLAGVAVLLILEIEKALLRRMGVGPS